MLSFFTQSKEKYYFFLTHSMLLHSNKYLAFDLFVMSPNKIKIEMISPIQEKIASKE